MKNYELMTITDIDLGDDKAKNLSKKVQDTVTDLKGVITKSDFWGKRKFAYELKHKKEGYYDVLTFQMEPQELLTLKSKLNLFDGLVRYLITVKN